jgi:hypothetical protein
MALVRLLLISALAATLIGCSSASQQTHQSFADRGLYQTHQEQSPQMHSKRRVLPGQTVTAKSRHRKNNDSTKIAKSQIVPKMDASSLIRLHDKSNIGMTTPTIAAKTETPPSSQLHDESVTTPTIAAKTETPPSSQLEDESVIKILLNLKGSSGPPEKMRSAILSTPFVASSGTKTADRNRFSMSSKKTRRTSAVTL